MTFYEAINTCLRKYATFRGRASRPEFFWFIGTVYLWSTFAYWFDYVLSGGLLVTLFVLLIVACPGLAVFWRRFQDIGLMGWLAPAIYLVFFLTAYAYWYGIQDHFYSAALQRSFETAAWLIPVLVAALPSQPGPNKYGPNPNEVPA